MPMEWSILPYERVIQKRVYYIDVDWLEYADFCKRERSEKKSTKKG